MNKQTVELSRAALRMANQEISPERDHVHELLLARLRSEGATVGQLLEQRKNDALNVHFLRNVVQLLPHVTHNKKGNQEITVRDEWQARAIQSHIYWSNYDTPHVLLGKKELGKRVEILAGALAVDDEELEKSRDADLHLYTVKPRLAKKLGQLASIRASEYPEPDDIKELLHYHDGQLHLTPHSPKATYLWITGSSHEPIFHFPDTSFAELDVHSHLERIAVDFGIVPALDELYEQYRID